MIQCGMGGDVPREGGHGAGHPSRVKFRKLQREGIFKICCFDTPLASEDIVYTDVCKVKIV